MDDTALKAALRKLLAHGDAAQDGKMMKMAAAKSAGPVAPPEVCPECQSPLVDGKCSECGYESAAPQGDNESELAELLEQGE